MHCLHCHSENPPSAKFCMECGHELRQAPTLQSRISSDPKSYTPRFLIEKILTTRGSIEGERKVVTVLFADVANYTSMSEKLDPEEVHHVMDECFRILMDEIHRYEGTINQFTGDGVMALFGAPVSHEDHAQRACLASLGIQQALKGYREHLKNRLGIDFRMRVGLNSGPVVVGSIGDDLRMDYSAIGDTTNLASRLERMAKPGTILVSENTYKIIDKVFECKSLGKHSVKGRQEPVEVFHLEAKRTVSGHLSSFARQIHPELVGRERELAQLEFQVMKLVDGEGSIVNIVGEAGIGKSRLVAELRKRDVMKNVTLLEARGLSMGRTLSFHPITHLLRNGARIKEDDTEGIAFDKLNRTLTSICPDDTDEVLPFVATMMGMKLSEIHAKRVRDAEPETLEKLILKSLRVILTKLSQMNPVVIVTDDLHWADTSSIGLMESLFRLAATERILFINVLRLGYQNTGDRIIETLTETLPGHFIHLVLDPLDERLSELLLANMLQIRGLHRGLIAHIVQRSGGNPFFIEEIVRSLIDQGAVVPDNGAYQVTERISTVSIPNTINDVLMARIDRLDEKTRDLLKVASVIGRSFFQRILLELIHPPESIQASLSYLKEIQLLRERSRMGEIEYVFKHALAQEAAYESILPLARQKLHIKVAAAIEKLFEDRIQEFYGMLAYHYSRAKDLEKAEDYLIRAGKEALKLSASHEALQYYQEALELYLQKHGAKADPKKISMLEKSIAQALYNRGQYEEAIDYFDRALRLSRRRPSKKSILVAAHSLSSFLHFVIALYLPFFKFKETPTEQDKEDLTLYHKKCSALATIDPRRFIVESLSLYKQLTRYDLTKFDAGTEIFIGSSVLFSFTGISFRLSSRILESTRVKTAQVDLRTPTLYDLLKTAHNYFSGDWNAIDEYRVDLVDRDLQLGHIFYASQYLYWHGVASVYRGSLEKAQSMVDKLNDIIEVYDHDFSKLAKFRLNTTLLIESRKFDHALVELDMAIRFARKAKFPLSLIDLYACKALVHLFLDELQDAQTFLNHADEIRSTVKAAPVQLANYHRSHVYYNLYRLRLAAQDRNSLDRFTYQEGALASVKNMSKASRRVAQHRTEFFTLQGSLYWLIKKQRRALNCWRRSIAEGERLSAKVELSRAFFEIGKSLLKPESRYTHLDGSRPEEYLEKARSLFSEMELHWDLEEQSRLQTNLRS